MSELWSSKTDAISLDHFEGSSVNTDIRTALYEQCAHPKIDLYGAALAALRLNGDERVLEVGCGNGRFIERIIESGHQGEVIGIDRIEATYAATQLRLQDQGYNNARFYQADMRNLPFEDNSFQALGSNYNLYHVDHPEKALEEIRRVVEPGGNIAILTRGTFNLVKHWEYAKLVAESLGFERPMAQYSNFEADEAVGRLSQYFSVDLKRSLPSEPDKRLIRELRLTTESDWFNYKYSLRGVIVSDIRASSGELQGDAELKILSQIEDIIKPLYDSEIAKNGYFVDLLHDRLIACINDKK